jgi:hypothetical protein
MIAISYRREDSMAIAGRLYDRLEAKFGKQNVFMDFDSIRPGFDFRTQIKDTIDRSKVVVAVIGPQWFGEAQDKSRRIDDPADFVRLEVAHALERGIPVIPVLINNTSMPKPENLPPDLAELSFRHAVPLDSGLDFRQHADRLIASVEAIVGEKDLRRAQSTATSQSLATDRDSRRTFLIVCGAAIVLISIIAFAIGLRSHDRTNQTETSIKDSQAVVAQPNERSSKAPDSVITNSPPAAGMTSPVNSTSLTNSNADQSVRDSPLEKYEDRPIGNAVNVEFKQVRGMIQAYYEALSQHDLDGVMSNFADVVDYQGQGFRPKTYIRRDAANYLKRWDRISFSPSYIDISRNSDGDLVAQFDVPFRVGERNAPDKTGISSNVWILRKSQNGLEIVSQRETVSPVQKRR